MYITKCPKCKRQPKIDECVARRLPGGNEVRRRICMCPNYCSVIPARNKLNTFGFIFEGNGDANLIYRYWNQAVELYQNNQEKRWYEQEYVWTEDKEISFI